jgi:hypothetical protein
MITFDFDLLKKVFPLIVLALLIDMVIKLI